MHHRLIFAHGAGRAGAHAWPEQSMVLGDRADFITFPGYGEEPPAATDIDAWVERLLSVTSDPVHLVAHSYGAIPAVLAAERRPGWCRSLVMFEPALYSLARGHSAVEEHIDRMAPVMDEAGSLDAVTFWRRWMTALTGVEPEPVRTSDQLDTAERFRLLVPPWSVQVPTHVFAKVPTLVVTAGWNHEYEAIAERLARLGVRHQFLLGKGHRLVDDTAATQMITDWVSAHDHDDETDDP